MSTTIDNKVVEMKFDNKHFESNVKTSMSTLDKLKKSLNFKGATTGLENINTAAKKCDMSGLSGAVDTIHAKFSALQVIGVTVLANITNSAVNAGKRMVSALTIDPIKTGFQEYETQINSIQTILANTSSKGTNLQQVNAALDELNTYADKTIYNFTEMTRNIGTFTAAGIDLNTSVQAIKGIANLAAVSGSNAQQASTAMYQLSQALASGTVKLMDWNSVVNAGMGGQVFQDALKETASVHGVAIDQMIEDEGSFRESLKNGWLTSDILTETLSKFTGDLNESQLRTMGYTEEQIAGIIKMGQTANDAATKVKTFTQLFDTLKEAAQSGWTQSWQLIVGDFEEAKGLLTEISDTFGGLINSFSESRNNVLSKGLSSGWKQLLKEGISDAEGYKETVISVAKEHGVTVDKLIKDSGSFEKSLQSGWLKADIMAESLEKLTAKTAGLSDEQLANLGYTREQVNSLEELNESVKNGSISLDDFAKKMTEVSGRELLIDSFRNIGNAILKPLQAIRDAWRETFTDDEKASGLYNFISALHELSTKLDWTDENLQKVKRTFEGLFAILDIIGMVLGGTFRIGFAVLKEFLGAMGYAGTDILELTASVGDAIVAFRDWFKEHSLINKAIEIAVPLIVNMVQAIGDLVQWLLELPVVQHGLASIVDFFTNLFGTVSNGFYAFIDNIKEFIGLLSEMESFSFDGIISAFKESFNLDGIPGDMLAGLGNGLRDGAAGVIAIITEVGTALLNAIKSVLGIHSPSTEMHEVGTNAIEGLLNGLKEGASAVIGFLKDLASKIIEFFGNIDWGKIFAAGMGVGLLLIAKKFADAFGLIAKPIGGIGDLLSGAGQVLSESARNISKVLKGFSKVLNSFAFSIKAKAIKNIAISLGILVGALILLTFIDVGKLWNAVAVLAVVSAILVALVVVLEKVSTAASGFENIKFGGLTLALMGLAGSILLIGLAAKMVGDLDPATAIQGFIGLTAIVGVLAGFLAAYGMLVKGKSAQNIGQVGKMLFKLSISLMIMIGVIKLISMLSFDEVVKGTVGLVGFVAFIAALVAISTFAGNKIDKIGGMLLKISIALGILVGVIKLISMLSWEELGKGAIGLAGLSAFIMILVGISRLAGKEMPKIGSMLLAMSTSMLLLTVVAKLIAGMSWGDMGKAAVGIAGLTAVMYALVSMVKKIGPSAPKIAATLLAMSLSIGLLAGVAVMLSFISVADLAKGVTVVAVLGAVMAGMIWATRGANDVKGNLIVMTVAIGVMATAIGLLSFIDPSRLAGATAALAIVMGMFALIEKASGSITKSISSLLVMSLAVGVLAGILYLLSGLPIESTLAVATSLSILLLALSASMLIISNAGKIGPTAILAIGIMAIVIGVLGGILYLLSGMPIESTLSTAISLSVLLLALSGACAILALVGAGGPAAFIGIGALATLIVAIGGLMVGIGALATYYPDMEEFLNKGISLLEQIGQGLGSFFGNMVGGFLSGATSGLEEVGKNLSSFMTSIQPFLDGASNISPDSIVGVKTLAETILLLSGANLIESITSFLTGGSSLADFAAQLVPFGNAMVEYSNAVAGINAEAITNSATAAKGLAEVANAIPTEGGLWGLLAGDKNLGEFGTKLVPFGEGLREYSNAVAGINAEAITNSVSAAKGIVEVANAIPTEGGLWGLLAGDKNLGEFGSKLVPFGEGLRDYSIAVANVNPEAITNSVTAAKSLTEVMNAIPDSGGLAGLFTGEKDLSIFSTLQPFGEGLRDYSLAVAGVDSGAISNSASAASQVASMINSTVGINTSGVESFVNAINTLGTAQVNNFVNAFNGASSKLLSAGSNMMDSVIQGITSKQSSLISAASSSITDMKNAITNKMSEFVAAGSEIIAKLVSGINAQKSSVSSVITSVVSSAASSIRGYYGSFFSAGSYLAQGFANGISSSSYAASVNARAMANAAKTAAQQALDENSPSKEFYKIGAFAGMGLVNALVAYKSKSYKAGAEVAESAKDGLSNAISKVSDAVQMDFDAQPTIRPVVDLSDVKHGARAIDGMLGNKSIVGLRANVNGINTRMNRINQNGATEEVVSAINKLRKDLENVGNTSYTVGDITYDDGSNISGAVQDLVRAARIERRV